MPAPGLITNYNVQQIFLGENWYTYKNYTNNTGSSVTINAGTVLGTIFASNTWNLMQSTNSDGSQVPTAIFYNENSSYVVAAGATVMLAGCTKGLINQNALSFTLNTDTINTGIGTEGTGATVQDYIQGKGIVLVPSTELSIVDPNQ